mgnify:CR=1 FL=1
MKALAVVVALALVVVYALGSGRWVTTSSEWYLSLQQPAWQPPPWVFGVAWAYNFTVLAIVGVVMGLRSEPRATWAFLALFAVTVALAIAWAYLFYGPHALVASAICLTLAMLGTGGVVALAWSQGAWLGAVLVPYFLWLVVATSLSWGYVALVPTPR